MAFFFVDTVSAASTT